MVKAWRNCRGCNRYGLRSWWLGCGGESRSAAQPYAAICWFLVATVTELALSLLSRTVVQLVEATALEINTVSITMASSVCRAITSLALRDTRASLVGP